MFRTLHMEILKLKRSPMIVVSILGVVAPQFLNYLMFLSFKDNNASSISIERYFEQCYTTLTVFIATIMFGLITTYIFNREYQEGALENVLTIPIGRIELIVNKMILLFIWIIFLMLFSFGLSILLNYMGLFIQLNNEIIIKYFKIYLLTSIIHCALIPVTIFITLIFKNYIPSIGFNFFATASSLIIIDTQYGELFPWSLPYLLTVYEGEFYYPKLYSIASIVLTFIISMTACIMYFNRVDIE